MLAVTRRAPAKLFAAALPRDGERSQQRYPPFGWAAFSREHSELLEIVASATGEREIECRDFGFVEVVFHSSLARLFSHVTFARTSSIRNRTPWLSDGFNQSVRSKMRSASSNRPRRQRHNPNPFMQRRNGRLSIQPHGSRPSKPCPSDSSPIRNPAS